MATRKFRKSKSRRTVRGRRSSTAGKILAPLDVRSEKHLKEFEKRIKSGDLTIILVWAQWCPHCHTMMPHFDAAAKSPNRSIQAVKVEEQMLPAINSVLTKNVNKSAKPLNVEGYPSIIVVDKQGNKVTDIEPVRDTSTMTQVMENAGPLANQAGLTKPVSVNTGSLNSPKASMNASKQLMANIGMEDEGLVSGTPRNIDMGEEELKGSIVGNKLNTNSLNSQKNIRESVKKPLNIEAPPSNYKKLSEEADEITSLAAPLTPPNIGNDMDIQPISNSLTPEQKLSGGGRRGGSLYSAMARTTYTLAPAAALLATAAMVMKGKKRKTRKHFKKSHSRRYSRR